MTITQQIQAEEELSEQLGEYAGGWVAVHDHKVVASAPTLHELLIEVGDTEVDGVFEIIDERGAACFF